MSPQSAVEILALPIKERVHGIRCRMSKDITHTCDCGVADGWINAFELMPPEGVPVLMRRTGSVQIPGWQWRPAS